MGERLSRRLALLLLAVVGIAGCAADEASPADTRPPTTAAPAPTAAPSTTAPAPTTSTPPLTSAAPAATERIVLQADGAPREYRLFVPDPLPPGSVPLVIDLHGLGSTPEAQDMASRFTGLGSIEGFVVAQPAARGAIPTWNGQPGEEGKDLDIAFLRALVADVAGRVDLDPARVYAAGFSNGGGMAHRLACEAADLVAAIGTVAGQYAVVDDCAPVRPVPVVSFHGTDDLIVPFRGVGELLPDIPAWVASWATRNECAPVPRHDRIADDVLRDHWSGCAEAADVVFYTIEEGGHAWPGVPTPGFFATTDALDATVVMWEFFAAHPRN